MHKRLVFALLIAFSCMAVVQAQADEVCTEQIQAALSVTDSVCGGIGRNQACYGNQVLLAKPIDSAPDLAFEKPGDVADLLLIDNMQLSQLIAPDEWGVALLQIQANLPDSLPGQHVVMLLFGEVEMDNAGGETPVRLSGTITSNANLRGGPGTSFGIVGAGTNGAEVEVEGRNEDSSWFRILPPDEETPAWIFGDLIAVDGSIEDLPVLEGDEASGPRFGPMQSFYFRTGITGLRCIGAPQDGILVQTPAGAGEILLQANQVDIRLGSTAFLRAVPAEFMTVDVIEGQGSVTALGTTVFVPAGARAQIPLNGDGLPDGPPELTVFAEDDVADLPVSILPDAVEIAAPLDESALLENSIEGMYMWVEDFPAFFCGNDSGRVSAEASGEGEMFRIERIETGIRFTRMDSGFTNELTQTGSGIFSKTATESIAGVGTSTYDLRVEWTSPSGGVWTSTTDYNYSYCDDTIERTVNFARVETPDDAAN